MSTLVDPILKNMEDHMKKSLTVFREVLGKVRTGRASTGILEHVMVSYYGNETHLSQVASISVSDARTLTINPFEEKMLPEIEKAILKADLGLNPVSAGKIIRVPMPALTEERRKEIVLGLKKEGENTKVAVRNLRQEANNKIKKLLKEKEITEDDEKKSQNLVQKITDKYIKEVEDVLKEKETEVMKIG